MSEVFNLNYFEKVYLLEFYINGNLKKSYAFSLPPQSEEFSYSQRISQTKTFGGIVFDDYGNDVVNITLTGSTVNNRIRMIFTGNTLGSLSNTINNNGKKEIDDLIEILQEFGTQKNLKGKLVKLINLDNGDVWQVLINNYSIKRSKERPMSYDYSISMTGINNDGKGTALAAIKIAKSVRDKISNQKETVLSFTDKLKNICSNIKDKSDKWQKTLREACGEYEKKIKKPLTILNKVKDEIDSVQNILDSWVDTFKGFVDVTLQTPTETVIGFEEVFKATNRLIFDTGHDIYSIGMDATKDIKEFADTCHELFVDDESGIFQNFRASYLDQFGDTSEEIYDYWKVMLDEFQSDGDDLGTTLKDKTENQITTTYTINPGNMLNDDELIPVKGIKTIIAKDTDTWDSISKQYYGTTDFSNEIAFYNGSYNLAEGENTFVLAAGKIVFIPMFENTEYNYENNYIEAAIEDYDNYGKDIAINPYGDIAASSQGNDLGQVQSYENVSQAINLRLSTAFNSRIKQEVYGIKSNIGKNSVANNFLKTSIKETVIADPRVISIDELNYKGTGDNIHVNLVYTDIEHTTHRLER